MDIEETVLIQAIPLSKVSNTLIKYTNCKT